MADELTAEQKRQVKAALLRQLRADAQGLAEGIEEEQEMVQAPFDDPNSTDERWHSQIASDVQAGLNENADQLADDRQAATQLDFSPTNEVRPGAVVGLDGERFIVGVVLDELSVGGYSYSGISQDSPLYQAMQGLQSGADFEFDGKPHHLDFVV